MVYHLIERLCAGLHLKPFPEINLLSIGKAAVHSKEARMKTFA